MHNENFKVSTTNCVESYFRKLKYEYQIDLKNEISQWILEHATLVHGDMLKALVFGMGQPRPRKATEVKMTKEEFAETVEGSRENWDKHPERKNQDKPGNTRAKRYLKGDQVPLQNKDAQNCGAKNKDVPTPAETPKPKSPPIVTLDDSSPGQKTICRPAFARSGDHFARSNELATLGHGREVEAMVLDTYIHLKASRRNTHMTLPYYFYLRERTRNGLENRYHKECFPTNAQHDTKLLFPSVYRGHYWLNEINLLINHIRIYDSKQNFIQELALKDYMDGLINVLKEMTPGGNSPWTYNDQACQQQADGINCGVFVMAFADELTSGSAPDMLNMNIKPYSFRNKALRELLQTTNVGREVISRNQNNISEIIKELNRN